MAEPDVFVQEFAHEPGSVSKESDDLWLAVGSVRFFVIRKFSEAVSQGITDAVKNKSSFIFNDFGDIIYKGSLSHQTVRELNPLNPLSIRKKTEEDTI